MAEFNYDLFVIGAGSGGVRASRIAASHGARVAVAEEFRIGGTCVIRGCVPKKMLVYASHFAHELHDAPQYGWTIEGAKFDWPALRDFVARDVDRLERAYTSTLDSNKVEHFHERATVTGANSVRLASGREITAKHILVATGAWPVLPKIEGAEHCITSNEVFHLPELPKRIVIQGAGYIAVEFAGVFNALGSQVTVVNRSDKILRGYDEDITSRLLAIMQGRGIEFGFNRPLRRVPDADPTPRGSGSKTPGSHSAPTARSRSTISARPPATASMRSVMLPTGSSSPRWRSARAMPLPIRCSAACRVRPPTITSPARSSRSRRSPRSG
jgi:glutathione reductase (NADPH)